MSRASDELELILTLLEAEDAATPDYANRPLEEWEEDTNWEAITAALAGAYVAMESSLTGFHAVYVRELEILMDGARTSGEAVTRFFQWSFNLPATVRAAANTAVTRISETLARLQDQAAGIAVQDAVKARIIRDRSRYLPTRADAARWIAAASLPVLAVPARVQTIVGREIATPTLLTPPDPQGIVDLARTMSLAGAVDKGRQAAHQSAGAGRVDATERIVASGNVGFFYASELLDSATCGPCADIDGTQYETMEAALADYPGFGGYKNCDGGDRCRGTVVLTAGTVSPPTLQTPNR